MYSVFLYQEHILLLSQKRSLIFIVVGQQTRRFLKLVLPLPSEERKDNEICCFCYLWFSTIIYNMNNCTFLFEIYVFFNLFLFCIFPDTAFHLTGFIIWSRYLCERWEVLIIQNILFLDQP